MDSPKNRLFFGDNLRILRDHIEDESVDLIYLDPPFNSSASYHVLFKEQGGEQPAARITAFEDTWHWTRESETAFHELVAAAPESLINLMRALRSFLGRSDMMAYLTMMAPRLLELHRVLKRTGSIYLHCDATASHYLKLVLDAVFGADKFVNEIIWQRSLPHGNILKKYGASHDVILFYKKDESATWNGSFLPHRPEYIEQFYKYSEPDGRRYRLISCINPNPNRPNLTYEWKGVTKVWKYTRERMRRMDEEGLLVYSKNGIPQYKGYLDGMRGTPAQDVWTDIPPLMGSAQERLGYPTQKPEALLERIIRASSNEGDTVLDPFCGCGTSITVAERLRRRWIGMDITHLAISLIKNRLRDAFLGELAPYDVVGLPTDLSGAEALATRDRDQFQWWAVGLVDGRPAQDRKRGEDTDIDGYIYFFDDNSDRAKKIIIQVESGHARPGDVRDLKGVLEREKAQMGALITLKPATKDMKKEAASSGFYESEFYGAFPKIQVLTIEEILDGAKLLYPQAGASTFRRAGRQSKSKAEQFALPIQRKKSPPQHRLPGSDFSNEPLFAAGEDDGDL
ncbi:MAG TPA: DNA methyltransferase [Pyrinomonadaceae bacterium]|jgi:DNA modification methylase